MTDFVGALSLVALLAGEAPDPPALVRNALEGDKSLEILDPDRHLPGGYTVDELRGFGYWPPWIMGDLDRDGRTDVAVVVVRQEGEQFQFGVIAVHAGQPKRLHWVDPLSPDPIHGVTANPAIDTVMPLHCIECDANTWYRWSGRTYAVVLNVPGEQVLIATYEENATLGVFERPSRNSRLITRVESCTAATIVEVKGEAYETRWYRIEISTPAPVRGWIPASFTAEDECVG